MKNLINLEEPIILMKNKVIQLKSSFGMRNCCGLSETEKAKHRLEDEQYFLPYLQAIEILEKNQAEYISNGKTKN